MTMRWTGGLAVVVLLVGGAQIASAADLPAQVYTKAAPVVAPAPTWTGFYAGVNLGGAWGNSDPNSSTVFLSPGGYFAFTSVPAVNAVGVQHIGTSGVTGGIEVGYNQQFDRFVAGIEADVQALSLKGSTSTSGVYPCCAPAIFTVTSTVSTNWLATVRGRLGFAQGGWLFFVTGGAAISDVKASWSFADNCGNVAACNGPGGPNASELASASPTKVGWVVGAGIESKFAQRWSWKAEYLHVDLGSVSATGTITTPGVTLPSPNPFSHNANLTADIGRVGLNYGF